MDLHKFRNDLMESRQAAFEAIEGMEDGGSCNFDRPVILKGETFPRKNAKVMEVFLETRLHAEWEGSRNAVCGYHIWGLPGGQGATRTVAAEAFRDAMSDRGWRVGMYYRLD